jgi:hypothetical protein
MLDIGTFWTYNRLTCSTFAFFPKFSVVFLVFRVRKRVKEFGNPGEREMGL